MIATTMKVTILVTLAALAPLGGDSTIWAQWGLAGLVVAYVLYDSRQRERDQRKSIAESHQWIRETLMGALERNTAALNAITQTRKP